MSISKRVETHLKKHKVAYEVIPHKVVYTTYDLANTLKEKLEKIAKTLLVKADRRLVLVVLPGNRRVDLKKIQKTLKAKAIALAPEKIIQKALKIKPGSVTPFGSLHGVEVLLDKGLAKAKHAIMGAGSFTESLRVAVKDLHALEKATLGDFAEKGAIKIAKIAKTVAKKIAKKKRI